MTLILEDIPGIMENQLRWQVAAKLMKRWFDGAAWTMPDVVKRGITDPNTLSAAQIDDTIVTMRWAQQFQRVSMAINALIANWVTPRSTARLRALLENGIRDSLKGGDVIHAWDVDRAEPRPDGRDHQENQALSV